MLQIAHLLVIVCLCSVTVCKIKAIENASKSGVNWTLLASKNFTRLCASVQNVAEARSLQVLVLQMNETEGEYAFIENLMKKVGPIVLTTTQSTRKVVPLAKLVIFIIGEELDVDELIEESGTDTLWTTKNFFIIVTATNPHNCLELFRKLWNVYYTSNVIFYATDGHEMVDVYNPFKNETEVTKINITDLSNIQRSIVKKMKDLNGYPIRVSIFPTRLKAIPLENGSYTGSDGFILATLARWMNFRPVIASPADGQKYGYKMENGTFTGALGDLVYDRADIFFNSVFIKDYETTQVQFTQPIAFDQFCLVVGKSGLRPHWKGMFLAFSPVMWSALLLTYFSSLSFWCFLRKTLYGKSSLVLTVFDLYKIFILIPFERIPKFSSERVAVVSFLWFSLSTATIFQGSMVKFLSYPSYEPDIETLKEVADENFPIITSSQNLRETFDSDDPVMFRLINNFRVIPDKNVDILRKVAVEKKAAALGGKEDLEEKIAKGFVENNVILLHVVEECPKSYHLAYMLPVDSPFVASINKVITTFVESGIVHSWYIRSKPFRPLSDYRQVQEMFKPLTMENVIIAFIIIVVGGGLSTVAFISEKVAHKYRSAESFAKEHHDSSENKLFRRSRYVFKMTRKRFEPFKDSTSASPLP